MPIFQAFRSVYDQRLGVGDRPCRPPPRLVRSDPPKRRRMMFSKTDHAYEVLRRQILDGHFQPGDRLRLSHIAQSLDLSELPVREALRLLQRDGLVVIHLHRGAEVARLSFRDAWEIEEVRLQLEAQACLSAAPFHDRESCARLRAILLRMTDARDNPVAVARLNRNFHTELMSLAP